MNDQLYKCVCVCVLPKPLELGWKTSVCEPVRVILHGTAQVLNETANGAPAEPVLTCNDPEPDASVTSSTRLPVDAVWMKPHVSSLPPQLPCLNSSTPAGLILKAPAAAKASDTGVETITSKFAVSAVKPRHHLPGFTATQSRPEFCLFTRF